MESCSCRTDHGERFVADTSTRIVGDRNDAIIPSCQMHCAVEDRNRDGFGQTLDAAYCRWAKRLAMTTLSILRSVLVIANPFAHRRTLEHDGAREWAHEMTHSGYKRQVACELTHCEHAGSLDRRSVVQYDGVHH